MLASDKRSSLLHKKCALNPIKFCASGFGFDGSSKISDCVVYSFNLILVPCFYVLKLFLFVTDTLDK